MQIDLHNFLQSVASRFAEMPVLLKSISSMLVCSQKESEKLNGE